MKFVFILECNKIINTPIQIIAILFFGLSESEMSKHIFAVRAIRIVIFLNCRSCISVDIF